MPYRYEFEIFTGHGGLAARVFRDVGDLTTPRPTVVVTGSWLTVKEQMPDLYAERLAETGFTAVTFDFSGFGASAGAPRQAELPTRKIDEIAAAARALSAVSFVRGGAVGHLAVCASAQYTLQAMRRARAARSTSTTSPPRSAWPLTRPPGTSAPTSRRRTDG